VEMRVLESEAGSESNLAATECWNVETVRSNPALFVQVTVRLIRGKLWGVGSEEEVGFLEFSLWVVLNLTGIGAIWLKWAVSRERFCGGLARG
jgi:hypothetical protein